MQCSTCRRFYQSRPGDYTYAAWCDCCEPKERRKDALLLVLLAPASLGCAWLVSYAVANLP